MLLIAQTIRFLAEVRQQATGGEINDFLRRFYGFSSFAKSLLISFPLPPLPPLPSSFLLPPSSFFLLPSSFFYI
jgi:hypothetical protein